MNTLLIANRGEIARRIIRTARAEGWRTVALCTEADAGALHVAEADDVQQVSSYLDIGAVVAAAVAAGAGFVHPGYGFLSERSPFARAVEAAGLTLVGPSADVMDAMGRKDRARDLAERAGVPVVPSYALSDDPASLDYPVLVKAAAGGGGKGMRVVRAAGELPDALAAAGREAASAFGDDTLLIEKYIESGRHVEVQVFGDTHGTVVHLFERDCSTQRRHQKVLEEAPAPTLSAQQRADVTAAGAALAREVGYTNAGTVEFLLDNATGRFYFLEMNTRLQVEHPVTEEVVRVRGEQVDLVALQLRIALGEELGFGQDDVTLEGHAIEARVYAEDSFAGFLPQAGVATKVWWPGEFTVGILAEGVQRTGGHRGMPVIRVDHALQDGQEVSTAFDPMLGKVITWGATREQARAALVAALDDTRIFGLTTNTGFLRVLAASEGFRDATIDTAWLDRNEVPPPTLDVARALAAFALAPDVEATIGPWRPDGWRLGAPPAPTVIELDRPVPVRGRGIEGSPITLVGAWGSPGDRRVDLKAGGERHAGAVRTHGLSVEVIDRGQRFVFERPDAFADHAVSAGDGSLVAPMPGTVLAVNVHDGDRVEEGQPLGVLEAMKMELSLKAPFAGTVVVHTEEGARVKLKDVLFEVTPDE